MNVYVVPLTAVNPVLVPFVTTISELVNPVIDLVNTARTGIGFVFVGSEVVLERVTLGRTLSYVLERVFEAMFRFPAKS